ncbi:MAG: DUF2798 domain-containing protein [Longicatena sp.]
MPKTKFEDIVFSLLMAFAMTYAMELYNLSLNHGGLCNALFFEVFNDVWFMMCIVIILEKLVAGRIAKKLTAKLFTPTIDKPIFMTLSMQCFTVATMASMMSLIATLLFKHPGNEFISIWLQTLTFNFPFAFFWQIFFAGPFVRFLFTKFFHSRNNIATLEKTK